ncbi:hypothetical protein QPK87_05425 [Kamptonema cortianum]|nr:hypothetical protein [Geitlerinema splendidum]MDK3156018.1 hypothetical protein [Kamptonema cortianum]
MKLGNNVQTWNFVSGLAVLVGVGAFASNLIIPVPSAKAGSATHDRQMKAAQAKFEENSKRLEFLQSGQTEFWKGDSEVVTPQILEKVTSVAQSNKLRIRSFRPQRGEASGEIGRLKYVVLLEGKFADVITFSRGIETVGTKIGLAMMQVSSADGETDRVNATLTLVAYTQLPPAAKPAEVESK